MSCRKWREHLVEAVYGELDGPRRADFERHLAACPGCTVELAGLEATAARVDRALPPRPRPGELDVWSRILPELEAPARSPERRGLVLAYPAAAALAAAVLALGVGLGTLLAPPPPAGPPAAETPRLDADAEFASFLERSTPLLLAVANRRNGGFATASFDPSSERRLAERLAVEAARLESELAGRGRRRQAALLADLEVVFLQIANLPEPEYRHGIELVQEAIESRALLFQLSVEEMRRL
jgi:hypothetical protein